VAHRTGALRIDICHLGLVTEAKHNQTQSLLCPDLHLLASCLHRRDVSSPIASPVMQELEDADHTVRQKRRRLPEGTSDYQAAWLLDGDDSGESGSEQEVWLPGSVKGSGHAFAG